MMGIEHYFALHVADEGFIPSNDQVEAVFKAFERHDIIADPIDEGTIEQLRQFDIETWESSEDSYEIPLQLAPSLWDNMISDMVELPRSIGGFDAQPRMEFYKAPYDLQPMDEESPRTRYILLLQDFGRGNLFDELTLLVNRFKVKFKGLIEELEQILGQRLSIEIQFA
jgi:hypothetical protein